MLRENQGGREGSYMTCQLFIFFVFIFMTGYLLFCGDTFLVVACFELVSTKFANKKRELVSWVIKSAMMDEWLLSGNPIDLAFWGNFFSVLNAMLSYIYSLACQQFLTLEYYYYCQCIIIKYAIKYGLREDIGYHVT